MMNGLNGMGWGMGFGWIFGIIFLGAFIWIIFRMLQNNNISNPSQGRSTLDILKENYANGLISKEEFEIKKRDILS